MIGKVIEQMIGLFRNHKGKIAFFIAFCLIFAVILFPYGDLRDYISLKVAQYSRNQVYLDFSSIEPSLFPHLGIKMDGVHLEASAFPEINMDSLTVAPNLMALLRFKPGISAYANGLLGGDWDIQSRGGAENKNGIRSQIVHLDVANLSLKTLIDTLELGVPLSGELQGSLNTTIDPDFTTQPDGDMNADVHNARIKSFKMPTQFGPVQIPTVSLKRISFSGKMKAGQLAIQRASFGEPSDQLHGLLSGALGLQFEKFGNQASVHVITYNVRLDFTLKSQLAGQLSSFLGLIDSFKKGQTSEGTQYVMHISSTGCSNPPCLQ